MCLQLMFCCVDSESRGSVIITLCVWPLAILQLTSILKSEFCEKLPRQLYSTLVTSRRQSRGSDHFSESYFTKDTEATVAAQRSKTSSEMRA